MPTPADRIHQHITTAAAAITAELAAITDPIEREKTAREALKIPDLTTAIRIQRAQAVEELKAGRTLREVAALLKVSTGRVDQILKEGRALQ
ncbi:RNA polymerase subunit sigma-70 [Streptomyces sp. NPDC085596]|uniref:RNA polymerase subunit sigma-70 n=1 Tax=Streptomyces sp. NPDC085596 TaxID=3365731 RepID=UPI0037CDFA6B